MPAFYPENNESIPNETTERVIQKILSSVNAIQTMIADQGQDYVTAANFNSTMQGIFAELSDKTEPNDVQKVDIVSSSSPLTLQGSVSEGDSLTGVKGIPVYGKDGSGNAKLFSLDASGNITVNLSSIGAIATETTLAAINTKLGLTNGYVDGIETLIGTTNTGITSIIGYVDGIETLIGTTNTTLTSTNTKLDTINTSLGTLNTTVGTGNTAATTLNTNFGAQADTAATTDTGSFSFISFFKRLLSVKLDTALSTLNTSLGTINTSVTSGNTSMTTQNTNFGAQADSVATTDTGTFSLIALIKRALSTLTTVNTSLGTGNTNTSTLNTNFGAQADTSATTDTGTFSFIALLKRLISKLTSYFLGGALTITQVSVTTSSTTVRSANATARGCAVKNHDTTNSTYIGTTSPATTSNTIKLGPGEGAVFDATTALYGISVGGTCVVALVEVV